MCSVERRVCDPSQQFIKDLVIARDYITHGFRKLAEEIAALELDQRRDLEIAKSRFSEIEKERFTNLDWELIKMGADGNQWHVAVDLDLGAMPPEGTIVECSRISVAPKKSD